MTWGLLSFPATDHHEDAYVAHKLKQFNSEEGMVVGSDHQEAPCLGGQGGAILSGV